VKAQEDYKEERGEGAEGGEGKDGAEESAVNHELVEANIGNTQNIFESVLMESDSYKQVKMLPNFVDLLNASDQIIDEKL
jgi:hypothetical protein